MKIRVEEHNGCDKSFGVTIGYGLYVRVDYDDVNHAEVDAHTKHMVEILEKNWNEDVANIYYQDELIKQWNLNEYGIQDDYEDLQDYLIQHGAK